MTVKNLFDKDNWILDLKFYSINLSNGKRVDMWTTKDVSEVEKEIKEKEVLIVESGRFEQYRILRVQTNQIVSIEDITESELKEHGERIAHINERFEVVKEIRSKRPSFFTKRKIEAIEKEYKEKNPMYIDYNEGEHLDPLMILSLNDLKDILKKCR